MWEEAPPDIFELRETTIQVSGVAESSHQTKESVQQYNTL